jgi:hypothetical protein
LASIDPKFVTQLMQIGILSFREQERLWDIAQRCAGTAGVPMAGAGAVVGAKAGSVTVPLVGAIPGAVAGALAGLAAGTVSCVMLNTGLRQQLRELARQP